MNKSQVITSILIVICLSVITIASVSATHKENTKKTFNSNDELYSFARSQPHSNLWTKVESLEPQTPNTTRAYGVIPMSDVKEVFWLKETGCMVFKMNDGLNVSADPTKREISMSKGRLEIK